VNRSSTRPSPFRAALLLPLLAALAGCGSSGAPTGNPQLTLSSCEAWCDAYVAAACATPLYKDVDTCKAMECADLPKQPAICQTKINMYYECQQAQADICGDMGCTTEHNAVLTCQ